VKWSDSFTYIAGTTPNTTDGTTFTFTNANIGTAHANRYVLVVVQAGNGNAAALTSCTIGGVEATLYASGTATAENRYTGIFGRAMPTGTTATVVATFNDTKGACHVAVHTVNSATALTLHDTASGNNGSQVSVTIDVPENGLVLGSGVRQGVTGDVIWSGMTRRNFNMELEATNEISTAVLIGDAPITNHTITATGFTDNVLLVCASFSGS
jgi:hypothetical protein